MEPVSVAWLWLTGVTHSDIPQCLVEDVEIQHHTEAVHNVHIRRNMKLLATVRLAISSVRSHP